MSFILKIFIVQISNNNHGTLLEINEEFKKANPFWFSLVCVKIFMQFGSLFTNVPLDSVVSNDPVEDL